MNRIRRCCPATLAILLLAGVAVGQDGNDPQGGTLSQTDDGDLLIASPDPGALQFNIGVGADYTFGSEEYDSWAVFTRIGAVKRINDDLDLAMGFRYRFEDYEFERDSNLGPTNAWNEVNMMSLSAILNYKLDTTWSVFGGPVFNASFEGGASFSDSWIYGGSIGIVYRRVDGFTLGGGLTIMDQLQTSARIFPIVVVEWEISENWRLSSRTSAKTVSRSGFELVYDVSRRWDAAVGFAYSFKRFRLDDDGPAPEGVGEDTSFPVWIRVSYALKDNTAIHAFIGTGLGGELELETASGAKIDTDYDATVLIGLIGSVRF